MMHRCNEVLPRMLKTFESNPITKTFIFKSNKLKVRILEGSDLVFGHALYFEGDHELRTQFVENTGVIYNFNSLYEWDYA
jgi:hypothetical protein